MISKIYLGLFKLNPTLKKDKTEKPETLKDNKEESKTDEYPLSKKNEAKLYLDLAHFIINNHLPFDSIDNLLTLIKKVTSTYDIRLIYESNNSYKDC